MRREILQMIRAAAGATLAMAIVASGDAAEPLKARDLVNACRDKVQVGRSFCEIYVSGFVHGAGIALMDTPSRSVCLPTGLTAREAIEVLLRIAQENPALLDLHPDVALWYALTRGFNC